MFLRVALFCLLASTGSQAENNICTESVDGSSSNFDAAGSDQSALLQANLGVVGDVAKASAVKVEETKKPVSPLVSCG